MLLRNDRSNRRVRPWRPDRERWASLTRHTEDASAIAWTNAQCVGGTSIQKKTKCQPEQKLHAPGRDASRFIAIPRVAVFARQAHGVGCVKHFVLIF